MYSYINNSSDVYIYNIEIYKITKMKINSTYKEIPPFLATFTSERKSKKLVLTIYLHYHYYNLTLGTSFWKSIYFSLVISNKHNRTLDWFFFIRFLCSHFPGIFKVLSVTTETQKSNDKDLAWSLILSLLP